MVTNGSFRVINGIYRYRKSNGTRPFFNGGICQHAMFDCQRVFRSLGKCGLPTKREVNGKVQSKVGSKKIIAKTTKETMANGNSVLFHIKRGQILCFEKKGCSTSYLALNLVLAISRDLWLVHISSRCSQAWS